MAAARGSTGTIPLTTTARRAPNGEASDENGRRPARRRTTAPRSGQTFIELLVAIVLLGTVVVGVLTALRTTVIGTRVERDHSKAQQWLQSGIGVIEGYDFAKCSTITLNGVERQSAYQAAIDDPTTGLSGRTGSTVRRSRSKMPEVWNGTSTCLCSTVAVPLLRQFRVAAATRDDRGTQAERRHRRVGGDDQALTRSTVAAASTEGFTLIEVLSSSRCSAW